MTQTSLVESQESISLRIDIPFSDTADTVIMEHLQGQEEISQPFEFTIRLASKNPLLSYKNFLGKLITISIHSDIRDIQSDLQNNRIYQFDNESEEQPRDKNVRYINGIVGQFTQLITATPGDDNATHYEAKIYPSLWLLKFGQDCRIFQNLTAMEIIKSVLTENNVLEVKDLTRTCGNEKREYCVQYNESCFDFIHRLLEEEGVFYYFDHRRDKHTLIFGDDPSAHTAYAADEEAQMIQTQTTQPFMGYITSCSLKHQVVPKTTTLKDYNFTLASTDPLSKSTGYGEGGEVYQYPAQCDHEDKPDKKRLEALALLQLQRDEAPHEAIEGSSTIPGFMPGYWFRLLGHPRPDANRQYVLQTVHHICDMAARPNREENLYYNTYQAFPAKIPFRPSKRTPKPRIYSTQTARVTGPENEEIWVDKYGRIKVLFHWDRLSKADQESSCWVRVAEGWAGNNWGILFTPRIGMEVVVTFIEGDPDRPLVIGSVYNSNNMLPYLPEQPTKSTIKSNSSKGGEGSNEIRFEDLKDSEQVYFHAQKDRDARVKQNTTDWIESGSAWLWIDKGNREAILGGIEGVAKTTPKSQELPAGVGDDNLTLLKGQKTTKLLGQGTSYNVILTEGDHFVQIDKGDKYIMGGQVNEFIQIDQGNFNKLIKSGDRSAVTYDGNVHDYIVNGHKTVGITSGSLSQEVINGSMLMGVDQGSLMEVVESGSIGRSITQGSMSDLVDQGNYKFEIKQGNADYKLSQGNETHTINGSYTQDVSQNHTLTVGGNLTIVVKGQTKIESVGDINFSTPNNIDLSAGRNVNVSAGMSIAQKAGMNISQSAGMSTNISADLEMSFNAMTINQNASIAYNLEAGAESSLKSGAMMSLTAALVTIG
ncbi:MAG: type VI secretion system tip protein TssI/VgrG [Janthinobacterium lividum]